MPTRAPLVLLAAAALGLPAVPAQPPPAAAKTGVVACVSPAAAEVGAAVLAGGGTAVDAAVAVGFALAVTWPEAGNVGGGGFMLVHPGPAGPPAFFDYRETAPLAATPAMFAAGVDFTSVRTAGVPGSVRGLALAHRRFRHQAVARPGHPGGGPGGRRVPGDARVGRQSERGAGRQGRDRPRVPPRLRPARRRAVGGRRPADPAGTWAGSSPASPTAGRTPFYTGDAADRLDAAMTAGAGLVTKQDLAAYKAVERPPLVGTYRGYEVVTAPPPSSGGTALLTALNILSPTDLSARPRQSPDAVHRMTEAMRRAYRDRAAYLGDPDFVKIPPHLTTLDHARRLAADIDPGRATPSAALAADIPLAPESDQTTHYSVVDAAGMAVATTTTLENAFGCRVVVPGAGYVLNNEMTDFNPRPGVTDRAGRIGTPPNAAAGGKRMLSSMCPTVLAQAGRPVLVTGSPGGRTIINTVLCVVVNTIDYRMTVRQAVDEPRHHHAWFPDRVSIEPGPHAAALAAGLTAKGHAVTLASQGDAHTIAIDPATGAATGAADRRREGAVR